MARVIERPDEYELWKSAIRGKIYVKRLDRRGDLIDECVLSGKKLHIRPEERRINQEMAASPELDPFLNGYLIPERLLDGNDDTPDLSENPNAMSDEEMKSLLVDRRSLKKLQTAAESITNPMTIQRFLAIAGADDVDATVKQVGVLKARLADLSKGEAYVEIETVSTGNDRDAYRMKAPESPAPVNPGVGRRA